MARPVDDAMDEERPEKATVRELWADCVIAAINESDDRPAYLTLAGAEGRDIEVLVRRDILRLTEVGAIEDGYGDLVVAIESSPDAEVALRRKFPGLKTICQPIHNILRSDNPTIWPEPTSRDRDHCRALVVNFDLNGPLSSRRDQGQLRFPVIDWIRKLAVLHAQSPQRNWRLCLTLHGELPWDDDELVAVQQFLAENFSREPRFRDAAKALLGEDLFQQLVDARATVETLSREQQQQILMIFVPKKLAFETSGDGWLLTTERNIRYGGSDAAPMVTWIIDFSWDVRVSTQPDEVYRESLSQALTGAGAIAEDGTVST